jgi:hypothetical protein
MRKLFILFSFYLCFASYGFSSKLLIYMDSLQSDHLRAYGVVHWVLRQGFKVEWLLNYRGGSFLCDNLVSIKNKALALGVSYEEVTNSQVAEIYKTIADNNMAKVVLEKEPKIAIYKPPDTDPWDDAVNMALDYAQIPYTKIWDKEVLRGDLKKYDWLHLHHEDFTGQYGKFYGAYRNAAWYQQRVQRYEALAHSLGYSKVTQLKLAVAEKIKEYVKEGGFLFAMCSATDTFDIALAAHKIDIVDPRLDGDGITPDYNSKLDFKNTLFFTNFKVIPNPYVYEFSNIDVDASQFNEYTNRGDFVLFDFSAKFDRAPTILTQDHVRVVKGFLGQTTAFNMATLKPNVVVLGKINDKMAKYIYTVYGEGTAVFLGGHDPEDFAHMVGEKPTNLSLHKNSPGYRLILNNTLYPAAKVKKRKT